MPKPTVSISSHMEVDHHSRPLMAYIHWRLELPGPTGLSADIELAEDAEMRFDATFNTDGSVECSLDDVAQLAQALDALVERVRQEQPVARRRLAEWRRRYTEALEPVA